MGMRFLGAGQHGITHGLSVNRHFLLVHPGHRGDVGAALGIIGQGIYVGLVIYIGMVIIALNQSDAFRIAERIMIKLLGLRNNKRAGAAAKAFFRCKVRLVISRTLYAVMYRIHRIRGIIFYFNRLTLRQFRRLDLDLCLFRVNQTNVSEVNRRRRSNRILAILGGIMARHTAGNLFQGIATDIFYGDGELFDLFKYCLHRHVGCNFRFGSYRRFGSSHPPADEFILPLCGSLRQDEFLSILHILSGISTSIHHESHGVVGFTFNCIRSDTAPSLILSQSVERQHLHNHDKRHEERSESFPIFHMFFTSLRKVVMLAAPGCRCSAPDIQNPISAWICTENVSVRETGRLCPTA